MMPNLRSRTLTRLLIRVLNAIPRGFLVEKSLWVAALLLAFAACGDNHQIAHLLDAPEFFDAPPEMDSGLGCCAFYPDEAAIGACAAPLLPPCTCAVTACRRPESDGGGFLKINSCGPSPDGGPCFPHPDAGVDAP